MNKLKTALISNRYKRRRVTNRVLLHIALSLTCVLMVMPFIWAVFVSFKEKTDIISVPPKILPRVWTLTNYMELSQVTPFFRFFLNSILISSISVFFIAITCPMAGYVLAKYRFKGQAFLFGIILATIFVPLESYIIPLYLIVKSFGWVNTYQGMVFPLLISSTGIFLLRQVIKSIPDDLIDSARIDGCSEFGVFWKVIFPLSLSATAAVIIINWVFTWSQVFIWYLVMASSEKMFPMEIGLMYFLRHYITDYGGVMAATVVTCIPVLVFFLIFRTRIIEGIAFTGMKH